VADVVTITDQDLTVSVEESPSVDVVMVQTGPPGPRGLPDPTAIAVAEYQLSTGPAWGLKLSAHPGDPSLFDIGPGVAYFLDHYTDPTSTVRDTLDVPVGIAGITPLWGTGGRHPVYISLDKLRNVRQSASPPTLEDLTRYAYVGVVAVIPDTFTVAAVFNLHTYAGDLGARLNQFASCMGAFNVAGNVYGPSSLTTPTTRISRTAGRVFRLGSNSNTDARVSDINTTNLVDPEQFRSVRHVGAEWYYPPTLEQNIDAEYYDNLSDLTPVPAGQFQIKAIFYSISATFIQYGQTTYATMADAELHLQDKFAVNPILGDDFVLRCLLIVQQGYTSLSNTAQAKFVDMGKFGLSISSGGGSSSGEVNTASNINEVGTGVFYQKVGMDLQFVGVAAKADSLATVDWDDANKCLRIGVNIYTGTGDAPSGLPDGSLYFKREP
jgi:hypothetical protein